MTETYTIPRSLVEEHNETRLTEVNADYEHLATQLARRGIHADSLVERAAKLRVAIPSWGVGTGGTRFARFPGPGEPRDVFEKVDDCSTVHQLCRVTPTVSLHIPWDRPEDASELRQHASARGLSFDAMNSNTFQDQPGQKHSYKFGSLTHTDPAVREQAVAHNRECIEIGESLGSKSLTVWIADGGNYPGQVDLRRSLDRYLESLHKVYDHLPGDWNLYLEHKLYEPAFYSTVLNDWGTSILCARELGPQASCLVDLGHHAPNTNIEMIVARLLQFGKLGGFHFNDSKYGDDDLDSASIHPFQLFLVFHELVNQERADPDFRSAYMLDQSHNVTDPLESLMSSAMEIQRAYVQAHVVDHQALHERQEQNDALLALRTLKQAFTCDVEPILARARLLNGGALDPIAAYRDSQYRRHKEQERPQSRTTGSGIV